MAIQLTVGDTKTVTIKFFDGPLDANGNPTGNQVNTPAQVSYTISDPTVLTITPSTTNVDQAVWHVLKVGSVTVDVSVPAASDASDAYSAFSGNIALTASLVPVTILSLEVVIA